jgi:DNA-binding Lrp family transcriptional regulator
MDEDATELAKNPSVSHCYDRNTMPDWPYNIYTMIHAHSRAECNAIVDGLAKENNLSEKAMLFSIKEWKKTSMRYFCEEDMHK